ncbi:hypothetical protein DSO57_1028583 [Entomophthora muscae]|uniref:Uncharacterized protein n=1 Tax=Entomophthora muscae TaxID=34485 RepID=A0ACC2RSI5_9FUNG|nr:hypothetical protein DSO57_1028583 [Entomophthora muscae]
MSNNSSISLTVLITVQGPLDKFKVLALLDTGADANFIKKDLEDTLVLPLYGSLDVKVGNSTYTDASSITHPVTFDLEGFPFRIKCNSTPNLSNPFIIGFPWLKECFLNLTTLTTESLSLATMHFVLHPSTLMCPSLHLLASN